MMPNFFGARKMRLILQSEVAECGISCLAMIASYYGHKVDLITLRRRHPTSLRGATLGHLISIAHTLKLLPRPVRLELESLDELRLPCIVHLDFRHFAVLTKVSRKGVFLFDPAVGARHASMEEFSKRFTGVAVELAPSPDFERKTETARLSLIQLIGRLPGLGNIATQILILAAALQVFMLASPFFMQLVVDSAVVAEDRDLLTVLGIGFLLLGVVQVGITALRSWLVTYLGTALTLQLNTNLFSHLLQLPVVFFAKRYLGDVVSRFQSVDVIQRTLATSSLEAVIDGLMAVVTLALMMFYSVTLSLIVGAAAALYALLRVIRYPAFREANEEQIINLAKLNSNFLETVRGIQSIKLFNREIQRRTIWQTLMVSSINSGIRIQRLSIIYQTLNGLLFTVENITVIWLGALLVLDGGFSIGMLFAFVSYKLLFITRVGSLVDKGVEFRMLSLHASRVSDIALADTEIAQSAMAQEVKPTRASLRLEDISFRYSESDPMVLRNLSLDVAAGECLAIAGPSGCGKTTLLKVIASIFTPTSGKVLIDGIDVASLGLGNYRSLLGCVMQEDQLFAGTIADNISFFDQHPNQVEIEACAELASIHEDIQEMPMAYHSLIGDMGTTLSGGQKQRILLARALYQKPRVLLLDEATSHLDLDTERLVNQAISDLRLTRIIVAHRPDTLAMANRVVRLESGELVQDFRQVQPIRSEI